MLAAGDFIASEERAQQFALALGTLVGQRRLDALGVQRAVGIACHPHDDHRLGSRDWRRNGTLVLRMHLRKFGAALRFEHVHAHAEHRQQQDDDGDLERTRDHCGAPILRRALTSAAASATATRCWYAALPSMSAVARPPGGGAISMAMAAAVTLFSGGSGAASVAAATSR